MSTPSPPLRLAVVGGGIAGLAAAHRLHRLMPHAELRLFEASGRLGGPLHTLCSHDSSLEQGADNFLIKSPWALDLCRELNLADRLVPTNEQHRRALVVRAGKLVPVPEGFVLMRPQSLSAMLRSPVLSTAGKLRLLAEPFVRVPPAATNPDYDESVASFATRRLGREVFERLVQPLVAGVFVADAHRLSLAATFPEFLQAEREHGSLGRSVRAARVSRHDGQAAASDREPPAAARYGQFVTLRHGLNTLVNALERALPAGVVRLRSAVMSLAPAAPRGWVAAMAEGGVLESFDGVIVATHAPQAGRLLAGADRELTAHLDRIEYASSVVATLVYRSEQVTRPLDGFGVVVPAIENRPIIAASFLTVKFPGHAPPGRTVIRVFFGGVLRPEMVDRTDAELLSIARSELAELVGAAGEPRETHVARWRQSMPQYHVGHLRLVETIERRVAEHPGLQLAGSGYRGVGIPQCIHQGRTAADRLVEQLAGKAS